jgi:MerR family transcriptional regulator, light-induced transcriptional regulator
MNQLYNEFITYLDNADKEHCVQIVTGWLSERKIDIITLYNEILEPALKTPDSKIANNTARIWEEHLRTSIIRTIIECCYPFIIRDLKEKNIQVNKGKVIVVCPPEELHEIGARIVSDYFTLCGFNSIFIGANTPQNDIVDVIKYSKPVYVAFSVTNHFNLVATRAVIKKVLDIKKEPGQNFTLIVGGNAFKHNQYLYKEMGADMFLNTFTDIQNLKGSNHASL